jgi:integrase
MSDFTGHKLALETRHVINDGRTIKVGPQVKKNAAVIVPYLKTDAANREVDLHPDIAEYLRNYMSTKTGLLFLTRNGTPLLPNNLEQRWLTPRLKAMGLDERGMGWHAFRRFQETWLRGNRCLQDINNYWMGHKPETMSELYSHLHEESQQRLDEAERVGYGFSFVPNVPKLVEENAEEVAA